MAANSGRHATRAGKGVKQAAGGEEVELGLEEAAGVEVGGEAGGFGAALVIDDGEGAGLAVEEQFVEAVEAAAEANVFAAGEGDQERVGRGGGVGGGAGAAAESPFEIARADGDGGVAEAEDFGVEPSEEAVADFGLLDGPEGSWPHPLTRPRSGATLS